MRFTHFSCVSVLFPVSQPKTSFVGTQRNVWWEGERIMIILSRFAVLLQSHQVYMQVVQGKWYIQSGDREKALGNPGRGKKHLLFFRHSHDQCLSKHSQNRNAPRGTQEEGMRWDAWVDLLRSGLQWCESHKTIQRCIVVTPCTNEAQVGRGREPAMRERKLLISDLLILWAVTYLYVWSFENTQEEWILHCLGNFTQQIYQKVLITNKVH